MALFCAISCKQKFCRTIVRKQSAESRVLLVDVSPASVNKVRLHLEGIWPLEAVSQSGLKTRYCIVVEFWLQSWWGMCWNTSATSPDSSADLFNFNFSTAPMSSCNVQGSSPKRFGCKGVSGVPANNVSSMV